MNFVWRQVQLLYQDESLAQDVEFQVQRLEMWTTQPLELQSTTSSSRSKQGINDIDLYLSRFCRWQSRQNPSQDSVTQFPSSFIDGR